MVYTSSKSCWSGQPLPKSPRPGLHAYACMRAAAVAHLETLLSSSPTLGCRKGRRATGYFVDEAIDHVLLLWRQYVLRVTDAAFHPWPATFVDVLVWVGETLRCPALTSKWFRGGRRLRKHTRHQQQQERNACCSTACCSQV